MAISPSFPPNLFASLSLSSSSSSPSLPFLSIQNKTHSSSPRNLKHESYCSNSNQTIDFETEVAQKIQVKKKRKLRPSFYEQVRDRWSLKNHSQRTKFPWQQQKEEEEEEEDGTKTEEMKAEEEEEAELISQRLNSVEEEEKEVNFDLGNKISAPWVYKTKPKESHFNSETKIVEKGLADSVKVSEFDEISETPKRVVNRNDSNSEDNLSQFGLVEEKLNDEFERVSFESGKNDNVGTSVAVGSRDGDLGAVLPWAISSNRESVNGHKWKRNKTEVAEKSVPEIELKRLRNVGLKMQMRIKVGAAGITQALVECIREKWKVDEVVKLKFEGPPAINMQRTHDALESRTGGLVIWRSGSSIVLFRGMSYKLSCVQSYTEQSKHNPSTNTDSKDVTFDGVGSVGVSDSVGIIKNSVTNSVKTTENSSEKELMDLSELNCLLDELGPRFTDWSGRDPIPVDADLLPSLVPGYTTPFRLLPHSMRHCLTNKQMTYFRRLARTVPPHFALGRNRELQGLATAMVKLWEKSAIAKIAIKRGVENTRNERMAEEIKNLTGGTLLSRNKDYIVFYRGNDFLSPDITNALVEREKLAELNQDEEEKARSRASSLIVSKSKVSQNPLVAGTLAESLAANSRWANQPSSKEMEEMKRKLALDKHTSLVKYLEKKLTQSQEKVKKAERALGKVQKFLLPKALPTDLEIITDEERHLFRKMGLSMKPFLCVGRRGVFDGTVENMHLHWKYRELVKIIVKGQSFPQVKQIAINLEAESGGLLISLDKTTKGYVIIVYRGKNYQRPNAIRPKNLLTRRQALARSIELQRREALNHHIWSLGERIEMLKSQLDQMEDLKGTGNDELYTKLKNTYSFEDEIEDEGEEAYLETYEDADDSGDEKQNGLTDEGYLEE
ncbi:hypothetical protein C5167_018186 [Papaver somniferum]|uniref:CRM domain-containing protein n=1 Tax=Papaver somniferum TaxID=3469 RepID=A0A4Y7ILJ1_PAPSO|nr:CRM-domain containing factor CFM3, chloroplastic/mitochondrial-like [Papaver somniferum]RZC49763.1 hypothetical protein C5167_018186 [Papaver somniferum]